MAPQRRRRRHHERILRSPLETKRALLYVLNNARRHAAQRRQTLPNPGSGAVELEVHLR
jgi:hypothetical protein